jgi:hypothetical protein
MAARFWVGGSGPWDNLSILNWSATSGGIPGATAPTSADTATFDANSGTAAIVTVAATATSSSTTVNKADINLSLSGSPTLCTGTLAFTAGTLTLNTHTLTVNVFSSSNSNVRTVAFGTGKITLKGNAGTIWTTSTPAGFNTSGTPIVELTYSGGTGTRTVVASYDSAIGVTSAINFNVVAGTDTVSFTNSSGTACNGLNFTGFSGTCSVLPRTYFGDLTIVSGMTLTNTGSIVFAATSGTKQITTALKTFDCAITFNGVGGTFAFQDALTQGSTRAFTITNGTVQLKNGVTSIVGSFVANNSSVKFLQSTTIGSQATLSQASGTVNVVDLTIRDINAVGGASWNAYTDFENTDAGNNDGWDFSLSPPYSTAEFPIALRSFTQPRRF